MSSEQHSLLIFFKASSQFKWYAKTTVLFHLTNSLVIMLKIHWGKRQHIFLHFASPYLTYPCLIMILGLQVIFSRVLMPSLPHFPFLQEENTDKVQQISMKCALKARLKYSTSGTYRFASPHYRLGTSCYSSTLLDCNEFLCLSQHFFRTDVMGSYLNHRV